MAGFGHVRIADHEQGMAFRRWDSVDVARGLAIVAMVVYHFAWDLSFFRLIATSITLEPAWQWFARCIAGSFLALSGFGLALAHARGFRPRPFLRRFATIAGAALAVTLVTLLLFPDRYIFFGILHCIAVAGVLALPFLKAPLWLVAASAALALAAPQLLTDPFWDHPLLDWLGLGTSEPRTNDYVPLFPWFGVVLVGLGLGRIGLGATSRLARWRAGGRLSRGLAWAGRKSLLIYLVHQPLLLGALWPIAQLMGPHPAAEAAPFLNQCEASCRQANGNEPLCRAACTCMVGRLRRDGLWAQVLADRVEPADQTRIARLAQQCLAEPDPVPPAPP
jgi:uncharacterized membrane protein